MIRHVRMKKSIFGTVSRILFLIALLSSQFALGAPLGLNEYRDGKWIDPDKSYTGKKVALILSGYHDTIEKCHQLASFFGPDFDAIFGFEYSSYNGIDDNAQLLTNQVKELAQNNHIFIIAHSMGGMVARYALEQLDLGEDIHYLLMLGTPNQGIPGKELSGAFLFGARIFKLPIRSLAQLFAGGNFLNKLNTGVSKYCDSSHYYAVQGTNHNGIFPSEAKALKSIVGYLLQAFKSPMHDGVIPCYADEGSPLRNKASSWTGYINVDMGHFELKYNLEEQRPLFSKIMESWNNL